MKRHVPPAYRPPRGTTISGSRNNPIRYNRGIIRPTAQGTFRAEVNHGYTRQRRTFKHEPEARAWIDAVEIDYANDQTPLARHM